MSEKVRVYLSSNVFSPSEIGSNDKVSDKFKDKIGDLWTELNRISNLKVHDGRFPSEHQLIKEIDEFKPDILGCHLSHEIKKELLENSSIFAVATSTMGYNHIGRVSGDGILITHTPGVLFETVADFTISIIMANLRNLIDLHQFVWDGNWKPNEKWDLDQSLCSVISSKLLGIVGLGQIGQEVVRRLSQWGVKMMYTDISQNVEMERAYTMLEYSSSYEELFTNCDIVSIHIPLNDRTEGIINRNLLKLMKKGALLVNTARGPIINFHDLLELLENEEISINLAFDVFGPTEPIEPEILERFKKIKKKQSNLRFLFVPHNASADAETRAKMNVMFLQDIIAIIKSKSIKDLEQTHLIPEQKRSLEKIDFRIKKYWEREV
jgi:glyoxylate reductase